MKTRYHSFRTKYHSMVRVNGEWSPIIAENYYGELILSEGKKIFRKNEIFPERMRREIFSPSYAKKLEKRIVSKDTPSVPAGTGREISHKGDRYGCSWVERVAVKGGGYKDFYFHAGYHVSCAGDGEYGYARD